MTPSNLARKLRLQDVRRALILNAPERYLDVLGAVPEGSSVVVMDLNGWEVETQANLG